MNSSQIFALIQSIAMIGGGYLVTIPSPWAQLAGGVLATIGAGANHFSAASPATTGK